MLIYLVLYLIASFTVYLDSSFVYAILRGHICMLYYKVDSHLLQFWKCMLELLYRYR